MTIDTRTPLSREQKLLAEIVVQLGNVTEAIHKAASGETTPQADIAAMQAQIAALSAQNADLQQQLANLHANDITPDNIQEVIEHLGIEVADS